MATNLSGNSFDLVGADLLVFIDEHRCPDLYNEPFDGGLFFFIFSDHHNSSIRAILISAREYLLSATSSLSSSTPLPVRALTFARLLSLFLKILFPLRKDLL